MSTIEPVSMDEILDCDDMLRKCFLRAMGVQAREWERRSYPAEYQHLQRRCCRKAKALRAAMRLVKEPADA